MTDTDLAGARLLVVGAGALRDRAFAVWARLGIHVVLADGFTRHRYDALVDDSVLVDARDGAGCASNLARWAESCDGITTLSEESSVTAARLAAARGTPGPSPEAALVARSKLRQRELCRAAGLAAPAYRRVGSAGEAATFLDELGVPAVLKPVGSAAGFGVHRVDRAGAALDAAWRAASEAAARGEVLAEEYLEGPEVSVEAIVRDGSVAALAVTVKETVGAPGFLERQHLSGAMVSDAGIESLVAALVEVFGIEAGPLHVEMKLDPRRGPVLVELATRPGGGWIPDITELSGWDFYADQARCALGRPVRGPSGRSAAAGVRFLFGRGTVTGAPVAAEVQGAFPSIVRAQSLVPEGSTLRRPRANWTRAGAVVAVAPDTETVVRELRGATSLVAQQMGVEEMFPA